MSAAVKSGELLTFTELFEGRSFRIPNYQRGYSWELENVKDFLNDISNLVDKEGSDYQHYAGTVVAIPFDRDANFSAVIHQPPDGGVLLDIVDGQQRLTTLSILVAELSHRMSSFAKDTASALRWKYLVDDRQSFDHRRRFSVYADSDLYFYNCIVSQGPMIDLPVTKSHKNLQQARDEIVRWLENVTPDRMIKVTVAIENQIGFLLYVPRSHGEVGLMFEVINNRGKRLSELDKVKNYLVYFGTKYGVPLLTNKVNSAWSQILTNMADADALTNVKENSFLSHVWFAFRGDDSVWEPYPGLKALGNKPAELIEFIELLSVSSHSLARVATQKGAESQEAQVLLHLSLQPSTAQVMPLVYSVFFREANVENRTRLLSLIERLSFRFYGCHIARRADSKQSELFKLANTFYRFYATKHVEENEVIGTEWLERKLISFVKENAPDKSLIKELTLDQGEGGDFYTWKGMKYFLACYEEGLAKLKQRSVDVRRMLRAEDVEYRADFYHREHLWAVNCREPVENQPQHRNKRRLGNFVLLEGPINNGVSNKALQEKIRSNFESNANVGKPNTSMLEELAEMLKTAEAEERSKGKGRVRKTANYWVDTYTRFFDIRETKMINFALERWSVGQSGRIENFVVDSFKNVNNEMPEVVSVSSKS